MLARCTLKPLVAVEVELAATLFLPAHGQANGVRADFHLLCASFVGNNAVVVKIPDHGQIQFPCSVDVGDICYPFAVGPVTETLC